MKTTFENRKGRLIVVDGVRWKYTVGRYSVVARSEKGVSLYQEVSTVKYGKYTDRFYDDRYDKSSPYGSITPKDVEKWIKKHPIFVGE